MSKDPYEVDPTKLDTEIAVNGTWVGGKKIDLDVFAKGIAAIDAALHAHLAQPKKNCC